MSTVHLPDMNNKDRLHRRISKAPQSRREFQPAGSPKVVYSWVAVLECVLAAVGRLDLDTQSNKHIHR